MLTFLSGSRAAVQPGCAVSDEAQAAAAAMLSISSTLVSLSRGLPAAAPRCTSSTSKRCHPAKSTTCCLVVGWGMEARWHGFDHNSGCAATLKRQPPCVA